MKLYFLFSAVILVKSIFNLKHKTIFKRENTHTNNIQIYIRDLNISIKVIHLMKGKVEYFLSLFKLRKIYITLMKEKDSFE